jgi:acetoin utilization protein AcuC
MSGMSEAAAIVQPHSETATPVAAVGHGGRRASFVGNDLFRREAFGRNHPLSISRQGAVLDLCEILGWLDASSIHECPLASEDQLRMFHDPAYLRTLRDASAAGHIDVADRERYAVGTMENPLFPGVYERAACTVGGAILAARLAMEGQAVFHPAGGTHHGRPDRASGFCYFNDPVFAILTLLQEGAQRVLYVDLDAHHGDGVQEAFENDTRVMTLSIHERERWPHSGPVEDRGGGLARNLPVPRRFNDSELKFLLDRAVLPLLEDFDPAALVITCGADALAGDPLSKLELSNGALWNAVERLLQRRRRAVVLGGGGYNPWTTVRCWAGLWGVLSGQEMPERLPPRAVDLLAGLECDLVDEEELEPAWLETLADRPNRGPVRDEVRAVAEDVMDGKE